MWQYKYQQSFHFLELVIFCQSVALALLLIYHMQLWMQHFLQWIKKKLLRMLIM